MPSSNEVELLRLYTADPESGGFFSNERMQELIDNEEGDLEAAAAKAWRIKAANVADWYNVSLDGDSLSRSEVFDHCVAMSWYYEGQSGLKLESVLLRVTPLPGSETESELG